MAKVTAMVRISLRDRDGDLNEASCIKMLAKGKCSECLQWLLKCVLKVRTARASISWGGMDVGYQTVTIFLAMHLGLHKQEGLSLLPIVPADHPLLTILPES